jgi:hypothetical protein
MTDGPHTSKGREDKTVLLGGDATEEQECIFGGSQTLIAIGTEAGKVIVFNVLGLLISETAIDAPVISIEWVGDMLAPSMLPSRLSSMSPGPRPFVEALLEDLEDLSIETEETGTVKKTRSQLQDAARQRGISLGPDLFNDDSARCRSGGPSRRPSDMSNGSPLQVKRTREHPRKKSLIRPRIATQTFKSPVSHAYHPSEPNASAPSAPAYSARRRSKIDQPSVAIVPSTSRPRQYFSHRNSSLQSPQYSQFSDEEFFTPPSTRRDKGKAPARISSPRSPAIDTDAQLAPITSIDNTSLSSRKTSGILNTRTKSQVVKDDVVKDREDVRPWQRRTSVAWRTSPRQGTAKAPETLPSLHSPTDLHHLPASKMTKEADTGLSNVANSASKTIGSKVVFDAIDPMDFDSPSSLYSQSISHTFGNTQTSTPQQVGRLRWISQIPQRQVTMEAPDTPTSFDSPTSLYSRSTSEIFQERPSRNLQEKSSPPRRSQRQATIAAYGTLPDLDSLSSLASRPTSRMFRDAARAVDGEEDEDQEDNNMWRMSSRASRGHRRDRCLDGEMHEYRGIHEQQLRVAKRKRSATIDVGDEMRKLRNDNEALRQEMEAMRVEFRALKDVLLASER